MDECGSLIGQTLVITACLLNPSTQGAITSVWGLVIHPSRRTSISPETGDSLTGLVPKYTLTTAAEYLIVCAVRTKQYILA